MLFDGFLPSNICFCDLLGRQEQTTPLQTGERKLNCLRLYCPNGVGWIRCSTTRTSTELRGDEPNLFWSCSQPMEALEEGSGGRAAVEVPLP